MEQTPAPLAKPAIFSGADASSTLEGNGNTCFPDSSQTRDLGFPQYSVGQALLWGGGGTNAYCAPCQGRLAAAVHPVRPCEDLLFW